ncbi:MAG TPA: serine hydrolase domain-containing protein [Vicinamibacterales bacterium]|jgi:CubicO group peptidase (beta-lactamase class C family)|nr:serine hydrolase domain-containing protein [Vicinamibacterales bacterium]
MKTPFQTTARVLLSAFVALSLSGCRPFGAESPTARVDSLFASWNGKDSPGCAVGISRNGAVLYEHGYGMANLELGVPITTDTVFALASITKSFTAMSIMLAVQQGKLSLDDEVQKYIPEWADRDDHIAIRHLLSHTSGLRDAFGLLGWADPSESVDLQNETIVRILARQHGLNVPPGTEYQYNNGGYALLASILKRATGQSLREFADANIFKPLGMTHTHVHDDLPMLVPNRASGYSRNESDWRAAKEDGGVVGNGGMYSTVGDLLRWEENFANPRVGTREMFATMEKPIALSGGETSPYGFGFGSQQYRGQRVIGHNGGDYGIATNVTRYPDQRFAVTVLCNIDQISMGGTTTTDPEALANRVADVYLADVLAPVEVATNATSASTVVKLSDADLVDKVGLYRSARGERPLLFTVHDGTLMVRSYSGDDVDLELTPLGANRFMLLERVPFEFMPAAAGRPKQWLVGQGKQQNVFQPIMLALSETELRGFAGAYRSEELGTTYTLEARDATLVVKSSRPDVTITVFSKDVFVGDWVGVVKFSRDSRGAVSSFTVNRDNARGVRFDRIPTH